MTGLYLGGKRRLNQILNAIPLVGGMAHSALEQFRDGLKAFFKDGMLFEELGFRYFGPVDGHDLQACKILRELKHRLGPLLLTYSPTRGMAFRRRPRTRHYHTARFRTGGTDRRVVRLVAGGRGWHDAPSASHCTRR